MRRMLITVAVLAATLLSPLATQAPLAQSTVAAVVPTSARARVIVKYRADSELMRKQAMTATGRRSLQARALGDRIGIALTPGPGITERSHVVFASGVDSKTLATRISAESDIEYAVPDRAQAHRRGAERLFLRDSRLQQSDVTDEWRPAGRPVVPEASRCRGHRVPTRRPPSINAEQAWDLATGSSSIVIADIDTGIRFDHPDLQGGNILPGYDMVAADDSNADGSAAPTFPRRTTATGATATPPTRETGSAIPISRIRTSRNCTVGNSSWHGTQTAGLMGAATNNGVGIASVGHGNVKVMPVRVLGKCGGFDSDIRPACCGPPGLARSRRADQHRRRRASST